MGNFVWEHFRVPGRWRASATLLLCLFLLSFVIFPSAVHAGTTHLACGGSPATALATAISSATSGDTIVYDQDCTVTLAATLTIPATKNLTFDGGGHVVVLDGGGTVRIFSLQAANNHGPSVTLTGLTLQHGAAAQGGAIFNDQGTLTITASALVNNHATTSGGAIENAGGTLTITNSTLSGNTVTGTIQATGGAIDNTAFGTVTITSSTISGNRVSSPAVQSASGGGIFDLARAGTSLRLTNTIVSGNTGGNCNGADIGSENPNGVASGGHNLIGVQHNNAADARCGVDFTALAGGSGDLVGTDVAPIDAKLGTLGTNGGHTPVLPLLGNSPAIDTGGAACPAGVTADQRGVPRPQGAACDIGAFESYAPPPPAPRPGNVQPPPPPDTAPQPRGGGGTGQTPDSPVPSPRSG